MADFGKLNFSVSFNPTSAFPLDARSYFSSLVEAQAAAAGAVEVGSADNTYFIGQSIVVVESNIATLYVIQPDKTLKELATDVALEDLKAIVGNKETPTGIFKDIADLDAKLTAYTDTSIANKVGDIGEGVTVKTFVENHTSRTDNPHAVTKAQVGLGNVTNDSQVKRSEMGVAGGVATLDSSGLIPEAQLPSYVDDVLEFENFAALPQTGESGKIYVTLDTNLTYRWSGTIYVEISKSLALGETSSTAYAGDKGKQNADNISNLQTRVASLEDAVGEGGSVSNQITTAIQALDKADSAEVFKYVSAVSQTDGVINVTRADLNIAAVNGLETRLVDIEADVSTNTSDIAAEVTRATDAENALNANLLQTKADFTSSISALSADLNSKITTVSGNLESEISRATAKDTELESSIANEVAARTSADQALQDQIDLITGDETVSTHVTNYNNPHRVTKAQVGLDLVENKSLDTVPTEGSGNYITSGAVFSADKTLSDSIATINTKIPTEASESNKLATIDYVNTYGGKIDTISVNNEQQSIVDKNVNITVPTQVGDLVNNLGFIIGDAGIITNIWYGSRAEFDQIQDKKETTLYFVQENE